MYLAEGEALAAAAAAAVAKPVNGDAPDGKFEDYVAAGARMADLVAAGFRAASNVAGAILSLCGSASGVQCGVPFADGADGSNGSGGGGASGHAGPASLVPYLAYGAGCDISSTTAGGRGGGGSFAAGAGGEGEGAVGEGDEKRAAQPADWKPKRGRPKKQEAGECVAGSAQCPEGAKRALFEAAAPSTASAAFGKAPLAGAP